MEVFKQEFKPLKSELLKLSNKHFLRERFNFFIRME